MREVVERITELHTDAGVVDREQLTAVFSPAGRLIVEAPAGYGKTKTLVSKVAYLLATNQVPNPKSILVLTFSVNAAANIQKALIEQLPSILGAGVLPSKELLKRVVATNYHGLCRRILGLYGYLLTPALVDLNSLKAIDDDLRSLQCLNLELSGNERQVLGDYNTTLNEIGEEPEGEKREELRQHLSANFQRYQRIVIDKVIPRGYIPYNAILLLTRSLLRSHTQVRAFYQSYFPAVVVDEFQDTNILQWSLLQDLVRGEVAEDQGTRLVLFGDPLQRIYSFIGAIRDIHEHARDKHDMQVIELKTNHRFAPSSTLSTLDLALRANAKDACAPVVTNEASLTYLESEDQESEARAVLKWVHWTLEYDPGSTVVILVRKGRNSPNTEAIRTLFQRSCKYSYFQALFGDEEEEYVTFHRDCLTELDQAINGGRLHTLRSYRRQVVSNMQMRSESDTDTWRSLLQLLSVAFEHTLRRYAFLSLDDKLSVMRETFSQRTLKQYLGHVGAQVILSTVHGAKGLEWDYVIIPDMEKGSFPSYMGLCRYCPSQSDCNLTVETLFRLSDAEKGFHDELNLFYVAITRAKRATVVSLSITELSSSGEVRPVNRSCLLSLPGVRLEPMKPAI